MTATPRRHAVSLAVILVLSGMRVGATMPPFRGGGFPDLIQAQMDERPDRLSFQAALLSLPKRILQNRFESFDDWFFDRPTTPYLLRGSRSAPVLMVNFSNSPAPLFGPADLQKSLFDGPSPTGTVGDYYKAISYGHFTMTGQTHGWVKLSKPQAHYAGPAGCHGMCAQSPVADMALEALSAAAILTGRRLITTARTAPRTAGTTMAWWISWCLCIRVRAASAGVMTTSGRIRAA